MRLSNIVKCSVAASGNDRVFAVVVVAGEPFTFQFGDPIDYRALRGTAWSPPVMLERANTSHWFFSHVVDAVQIVSNGRRRAVVG